MSKRNEDRQGYKLTKVGWIPVEWECFHLKDIALINPESLSEKTDPSYKFYYLDLGSVCEGKINIPKAVIAFANSPSRARRLLRKEDIMLATVRPNLKGHAYIDFNVKDIVCSTGYAVIRVEELISSKFVYHTITSARTEKYFHNCVVGTNYPALNNSDVNNLLIPLPPLTEQAMIAEILSSWDWAIEQIVRLIKAKKQLKKGLMQQLLTGRIRFPKFIKSNRYFKDRFYSYPSDWKNPQIVEIGSEINERNASELQITVFSCSKHKGFVRSVDYFGKKVFSDDTSNYKVIKRGQFGFPINHVEEGSIGLLANEDKGLLSPIYTVFKVDKLKVNASYLYKLFKTEIYRHIFSVSTNSSVNRRGSLRWKQFSKIHIPMPPIEEQRYINSTLDFCDKEIQALEVKASALQKQKKALMQKLLTGEIRVKVGQSTKLPAKEKA